MKEEIILTCLKGEADDIQRCCDRCEDHKQRGFAAGGRWGSTPNTTRKSVNLLPMSRWGPVDGRY